MPGSEERELDIPSRPSLLAPHSVRVSLSRSPHPYRRRADSLHKDQDGRPAPQAPSSESVSRSDSTESGTEADDERASVLKRLPAPPVRSRKGLRGSTPIALSPAISPLPTPPPTFQETFQETLDFFGARHDRTIPQRQPSTERKKREIYIRRKKAEILRRGTEIILLCGMGFVTFLSPRESSNSTHWPSELIIFMIIPPILYALYPVRKAQLSYSNSKDVGRALATGFHIPSRFDPGPLIYPVALPVIVAVSLATQSGVFLAVNIVCCLSSVPPEVTAVWHQPDLIFYLHWIASVLPFHFSSSKLFGQFDHTPVGLRINASTVTGEDLVLILPLHRALRSVLEYMTTTSLDPAELELLATGLIDLFMLGRSPQAQLLTALLWVGGLCIFICCRHLLSWEIELARIPKWKFTKLRADSITQRISRAFSAFTAKPASAPDSSDDEIDSRSKLKPLLRVRTLAAPFSSGLETMPVASATPNGSAISNDTFRRLGRRSTISALDHKSKQEAESKSWRSGRSQSLPRSGFLSLTIQEARFRKYLFAGAVYVLVILIALGPVRSYISMKALSNYEPFGWALGYLFGNTLLFRDLINHTGLNGWIPLPPPSQIAPANVEVILGLPSQPANVRLFLCGYCIVVLIGGIATVLSLTSFVEVDTRRKGFHGIMVLMLLPTIFVDPCFFALALALILAAFLLLDLFRASQLPPISRPLTNFLAPYVDGRDHRGPVIISHIFLLIGCAIPLWLSLAGLPRIGTDPWKGWDTPDRNLSMVSGVICVGMGDAAASLVGRRFGRTKWYWGGGKSLEGSLAFAAAVTLGLIFSHTWLRVGGWKSWDDYRFSWILTKCIMAGMGASLLESVLTAANDNVVVPVGLWLLVRGFQI